MKQNTVEASEYPLSDLQIESYRRDGFIRLDDVFVGDELRSLRDAVAMAVAAEADRNLIGQESDAYKPSGAYAELFTQRVNLWTRHADVQSTVSSHPLGNIAARLEGVGPMRVWHDQALFKEPRGGSAATNRTPWHQDAVFWPHQQREHQTTIWIALKDATVANGCMAFVPGSQKLGELPPVSFTNPADIFESVPAEVRGVKPRVCELPAGSVTFHNGLTLHFAGPNKTEAVREAFAIIYMPDGTTYNGQRHIVTDPLGLSIGERLEGEMFPIVSTCGNDAP
jgi:ectoine hydroxylase-related dioxygenase (phytanoyl-CoA dioxygenase family)